MLVLVPEQIKAALVGCRKCQHDRSSSMETFVKFKRAFMMQREESGTCFMVTPNTGYYVDEDGTVVERQCENGQWKHRPMVALSVLQDLKRM